MTAAGLFAERVQGRLDRLDLSPEDASRLAGQPGDFVRKLLDGAVGGPPRGKRLIKLANVLATSMSYLVGLIRMCRCRWPRRCCKRDGARVEVSLSQARVVPRGSAWRSDFGGRPTKVPSCLRLARVSLSK